MTPGVQAYLDSLPPKASRTPAVGRYLAQRAQAVVVEYTSAARLADLKKLAALPVAEQKRLALAQLAKTHEALDEGASPLYKAGLLDLVRWNALKDDVAWWDKRAKEADAEAKPADAWQAMFVQCKILAVEIEREAGRGPTWRLVLDDIKAAARDVLDRMTDGGQKASDWLERALKVGGSVLIVAGLYKLAREITSGGPSVIVVAPEVAPQREAPKVRP